MGRIDLTSMVGKKSGRLTVKERDLSKPTGHGKESYWICECECGNSVSVRAADLKNGHTQSCGCLRKDLVREKNTKDISGQRFGMLVAKESTNKTNSHNCFMWRCECDCGNTEYYCSTENLLSGKVNSCGCKHAPLGEKRIAQILEENNIAFNSQQTFAELKSNNRYLRYDFAILDNENNIIRLIEFDGEQHYDPRSIYYSDHAIELDNIKNEYAKKQNIPLARIPYSKLNELSLDLLFDDQYLV